jgi:hypothetical protein
MASLPLPARTCSESSKSVETLLRSRLSRFLVEPAPWKAPFREMVDVFRGKEWKAVLFGGVLRDLVLYGPAKRPRDIDIVVDCSLEDLSAALSSFPFQRTRFGGFRIAFRKWSFDIWPLRNTWAFAVGHMTATFENLPKTTFFNIEAVAVQFNTKRRNKRPLYSFGFAEAISTRVLDINFEPNPFPQLCIIRGLLTAARHGLLLSPRLARYMLEKGNRTEIAEIMQAQFGHYGVVRLRAQDIVSSLDHIEYCLRESSLSPLRLPQTAGEQLLLPSFDHIEIS